MSMSECTYLTWPTLNVYFLVTNVSGTDDDIQREIKACGWSHSHEINPTQFVSGNSETINTSIIIERK